MLRSAPGLCDRRGARRLESRSRARASPRPRSSPRAGSGESLARGAFSASTGAESSSLPRPGRVGSRLMLRRGWSGHGRPGSCARKGRGAAVVGWGAGQAPGFGRERQFVAARVVGIRPAVNNGPLLPLSTSINVADPLGEAPPFASERKSGSVRRCWHASTANTGPLSLRNVGDHLLRARSGFCFAGTNGKSSSLATAFSPVNGHLVFPIGDAESQRAAHGDCCTLPQYAAGMATRGCGR